MAQFSGNDGNAGAVSKVVIRSLLLSALLVASACADQPPEQLGSSGSETSEPVEPTSTSGPFGNEGTQPQCKGNLVGTMASFHERKRVGDPVGLAKEDFRRDAAPGDVFTLVGNPGDSPALVLVVRDEVRIGRFAYERKDDGSWTFLASLVCAEHVN